MEDRQRARFAADELAVVLSRYDLGPIESITEFRRGSRKSPKVGIVCERGKFLLKRRPPSRASARRLAYAHRLQAHLSMAGFPLPRLVAPANEEGQVLHWGSQVYELFDYVRGQSYNGTATETRDAGQTLARFHRTVDDFPGAESSGSGDYHDSNPVRTALNSVTSTLSGHDSVAGAEGEVLAVAQELYDAYDQACEAVQGHGLRNWPAGVIHCDWHPGNMLFRTDKVVAVIDYDSIRLAQRIIDVANGALQFSIRSAKEPEDWPAEIDEPRAAEFLAGYASERDLTTGEQACLVYLMIEALIAESVLPIAATGSFGRHHGFRFMKMVRRKTAWLLDNADRLSTSLPVVAPG
ncbi:MAG: phosphotransferase [bacterium]|nr:phosphotransferase [bacterium]